MPGIDANLHVEARASGEECGHVQEDCRLPNPCHCAAWHELQNTTPPGGLAALAGWSPTKFPMRIQEPRGSNFISERFSDASGWKKPPSSSEWKPKLCSVARLWGPPCLASGPEIEDERQRRAGGRAAPWPPSPNHRSGAWHYWEMAPGDGFSSDTRGSRQQARGCRVEYPNIVLSSFHPLHPTGPVAFGLSCRVTFSQPGAQRSK